MIGAVLVYLKFLDEYTIPASKMSQRTSLQSDSVAIQVNTDSFTSPAQVRTIYDRSAEMDV